MSDQYEKVSADMDPLQKLLTKVPGFSGYMERKNRRDADKLLRLAIAKKFDELWSRVSEVQKDFLGQGQIQYIDDLESAAIKLRTFSDMVRTASYGYSSFFDATKINEEELQNMYQYDASMFDLADEVSRAIDNVETSVGSDGLPAAIRHLISTCRSCIDAFHHREEALTTSNQL